jgi:hypothetical protein
LFTTGYKRLAEGGHEVLMGDFDWLPLMLLLAVGSPPEQLSALRTLYIGFRKAKLKRAWYDASLRTKTLRVMLIQFLDGCCCFSASLCTETLKGKWGSVGLRAKTLREIMLKKSKEKT